MSFSKLPSVIGPAPSEMTNEELLLKLTTERDRVRRTIIHFREQFTAKAKAKKKPTAAKKKGGKPATKLTTKMNKAGVTIEQMEKALAQLMLEKENTNDA